jgi:hypothetical protein
LKLTDSQVLVTFAAFIYLPASFAAAIFGMNVQEINETGRGITTFVVTAVVLLVTTLLVWALSVRIARYRKDRRLDVERYVMRGGDPPTYTFWYSVLDAVCFVRPIFGSSPLDRFVLFRAYRKPGAVIRLETTGGEYAGTAIDLRKLRGNP